MLCCITLSSLTLKVVTNNTHLAHSSKYQEAFLMIKCHTVKPSLYGLHWHATSFPLHTQLGLQTMLL